MWGGLGESWVEIQEGFLEKWTGSMVSCYILTKNLAIWSRVLSSGRQQGAAAGTPDLSGCPSGKSQLCHLLAVRPWASSCTALGLGLCAIL